LLETRTPGYPQISFISSPIAFNPALIRAPPGFSA
jgi:hypothetical protein